MIDNVYISRAAFDSDFVRDYLYDFSPCAKFKGGSSTPPPQVVGHHYSVGMHMIVCHGPIDGIKQIWQGEKIAWPDAGNTSAVAADGTTLAIIDEPELFGGEDKEGGIVGNISIAYGEVDQAPHSYLISRLDPSNGFIPAFRGLVGIILKQVRVGTSPYIKPLSFLGKRTDILQTGAEQWYIAKADINGDLNPVHTIRECLTSAVFGLGNATSTIDSMSFEAAADTLYTENFGLSFLWGGSGDIEEFINDVLAHIDGVLYQDITTGNFILKLARDDYVVGDLDVFDDSAIEEIKDFSRETFGQIIDQIVINYHDTATDKPATATVQDIAVIDLQGGKVIEQSISYRGVSNATLANELAARELNQVTSMLARMTIISNRRMSSLQPNDVFKLTWPILDITEMVVRIITVNYGSLTEGKIEFGIVEDIFQATSSLIADPPDTEWTDPVSDPADVTAQELKEIPYWSLIKEFGTTAVGLYDDDVGFFGVAALQPSSDSLMYELQVRNSLTANLNAITGNSPFCPTATLDTPLPLNAADATIVLNDVVDLAEVSLDTYALIEDELVKILAIDTALNEITIARGILDTVPAAHNADVRVWFVEQFSFFVQTEYADSEQPGVKILPTTGKGRLNPDDATIYNADIMNSRQVRPYAPGNLKVDSASYPATFSGQPTLTWNLRNRLTQTVELVEHSDIGVTPEVGQTITIKIYDETLSNLLRTVTGLAGTTYTYTEEDEIADSGLGSADPLNTQLRFVIYSVRDGYDSLQQYDITVARV